MTIKLKKSQIIWFFVLSSLIIASNFAIYRVPQLQPIPKGMVLGSLFDFIFVLPLIVYFFIIRKRYSLKNMGLAVIAGLGAAYLIIPKQHLEHYPFIPYVVFAAEGAFILVEIYIIYKIASKLLQLKREATLSQAESPFFLINLRNMVKEHFPNIRLLQVLVTEFSMFYYAVFSWGKKLYINDGQAFTFHKKTSVIGLNVMLIHAILIETIGIHVLLHQWNAWVAYILLFLNVYSVFFFLAEIQAIRLTPFLLTNNALILQVGLSKSMVLPIKKIKELKHYEGPEKIDKKELSNLYDARVADFIMEKPAFEIILKQSQELHLLFGLKKKVNRIILNVDDEHRFYEQLKMKMSMYRES